MQHSGYWTLFEDIGRGQGKFVHSDLSMRRKLIKNGRVIFTDYPTSTSLTEMSVILTHGTKIDGEDTDHS